MGILSASLLRKRACLEPASGTEEMKRTEEGREREKERDRETGR